MFKSTDLNGSDPTDCWLEDCDGCFSESPNKHCKVCKQHLASPRVMACLHTFCEECLPLFYDTNDLAKINTIVCPDCKRTNQTATYESAGLASFHNDSTSADAHDTNSDELFSDAERDEIAKLLMSAEVKVDKAVKSLSISLNELEKQMHSVRKQIECNAQSFMQISGQCRDNAFQALKKLHSERELKITDLLHDLQTSADNIEKICESTRITLQHTNGTELLSLRQTVDTQIVNLIKYAPQVDVKFSLNVFANYDKLNAQSAYGWNWSPGKTMANKRLNYSESSSMQSGSPSVLESVSMLNGFMPTTTPAVLSPIGTMPVSGNVQSNGEGHSFMRIVRKFGSLGTSSVEFFYPHGFCLGVDEEIVVADTNNHRIAVFEKNGTFKFQFGIMGTGDGLLWRPRKVAVIRTNGKFVVCDRGNERSRMQIFSERGRFINKVSIAYISIVACLAVTDDARIVVVDSVLPRVYFMSEYGMVLTWFDCGKYVCEPSDVAIKGSYLYICDFKGHCVAIFTDDGVFQNHIGDETITRFPNGIEISDAGEVFIGDSHGNRVHVSCYSSDGILQWELICPHTNVSRCCGLKITSEGYIVTLAKNNHHVLVLSVVN